MIAGFFSSAASVLQSDTENRLMMMEGHMAQRKVPSCIPHDIGDPGTLIFFCTICYICETNICTKLKAIAKEASYDKRMISF